jgi:hypothetical protein
MDGNANEELRSGGSAILIEISEIDDVRNSDDVKVDFYRAVDPLVKADAGNFIPLASYRAFPNYHLTTRGKISGGVLTTMPFDAYFPFYANGVNAERDIRDMRVRLQIAPDAQSANGLVAGYYDFDSWWDYIRREGYLTKVGHFDCPALFAAARQLVDGHPDAKTGRCTAISSAFKVVAVSAFVIHPEQKNAGKGEGDAGRQGAAKKSGEAS